MAWNVWGEIILTADFSGTPRVFQPVVFNSNTILRGMRTWVIFYNNPTLTSLQMKIWSDNNGYPGKLLHTSSNTQLKADMITLANGAKEIFFDFDTLPTFRDLDTYHFALSGSGYTGTSSSHIAWMKGFPDPIYKNGIDVSLEFLVVSPYQMSFIGADI